LELTVLLQLDLKNFDVLCFTEQWLKEEQIGLTNVDHFDVLSTFSIISNGHGGSNIYIYIYIYIKERIQTKEQNCLQKLYKEKDFGMS
jgi:hypothetical protein